MPDVGDELQSGRFVTEELPRCERHGARTRLTCADCGAPICPKCSVRTDVGLKCERDAAPLAPVPAPAPAARSRRGFGIAVLAAIVGLAALAGAVVVFRGAAEREPPADVAGTWLGLPALTSIRGTTTAVALADGRVVVAGGGVGSVPVAATEIFDPASGTWSQAGDLAQARRGHRAVLLRDGRILAVGGLGLDGLLASAELFDLGNGAWSPVADAGVPRLGHTATVLPDGTVLVSGGTAAQSSGEAAGRQSVQPIASAEVFDPATGAWSQAAGMLAPRFEATATLLPDGRVLIAGGLGSRGVEASAELYDPATRTFSRTGSMATGRANHAAAALDDGRILVTSGASEQAALRSAELYDPTRGSWTEVADLNQAREGHTATPLRDGTVLIAAGEQFTQGARRSLTSAERYDPAANTWQSAGTMSCPRSEQAAALLPDGGVLIVAGDAAFPGDPPIAQSCAERYQP